MPAHFSTSGRTGKGKRETGFWVDHVSEPSYASKNLFFRSPVDSFTIWFAGHLCWSKEESDKSSRCLVHPRDCAATHGVEIRAPQDLWEPWSKDAFPVS